MIDKELIKKTLESLSTTDNKCENGSCNGCTAEKLFRSDELKPHLSIIYHNLMSDLVEDLGVIIPTAEIFMSAFVCGFVVAQDYLEKQKLEEIFGDK